MCHCVLANCCDYFAGKFTWNARRWNACAFGTSAFIVPHVFVSDWQCGWNDYVSSAFFGTICLVCELCGISLLCAFHPAHYESDAGGGGELPEVGSCLYRKICVQTEGGRFPPMADGVAQYVAFSEAVSRQRRMSDAGAASIFMSGYVI